MLNKIKRALKRKKLNKNERLHMFLAEQMIEMKRSEEFINEHIVAIARLSLIKPEKLFKEAKNTKANAEYLLKMVEERKESETK